MGTRRHSNVNFIFYSATALCINLTRSGFSENCRPFQCASFFFFYIPENDILETLLRTQAVRSLPTVTRQDDKRATATRTTTSRRSSRHFTDFQFVICYKPAVLVWKCLHDAVPRYLADLCVPTASTDGRLQSRSAVSSWCHVYWPAQLCLLWP